MKRKAKRKIAKPKKRRHHKPLVVNLPSSLGPTAEQDCGDNLQWTVIGVGAKGQITEAPAFLSLCSGDFAVWLVKNRSGTTLKLKLKDFKKVSNGQAVSPFDFVDNNVNVANGTNGVVVGHVVFDPPPGDPVKIKYTMEVRGPAIIDYDPDLEIKPGFGN